MSFCAHFLKAFDQVLYMGLLPKVKGDDTVGKVLNLSEWRKQRIRINGKYS